MLENDQIKASRISEFLEKPFFKRWVYFMIASWSSFSTDTSSISCISSVIKYAFPSISTFLRNSSENLFITYTSHLFVQDLSFLLDHIIFFWFVSNKKKNIFYDTKYLHREYHLHLQLKLQVYHLLISNLKSSFQDVLRIKHICLVDGNLFRVNSVSEWKKGNISAHRKGDNFWRHQRFGAKILLP